MRSILVVCIGNICRSPMAQAVLAATLPDVSVSSAGIGALIGRPADRIAQDLVMDKGLDLSEHRARQINRSICQQSDLILTMDENQRRYIEAHYPTSCGKVFRLGHAAKFDIPDPYQKDKAEFVNALQLIEIGVVAWADRIRKL